MTPAKLKPQVTTTDTPDDEARKALELVAGLSSAARSRLASMGCVIPNISGSEASIKYAYRCSNCGNAALYFVGEVFDNGQGATSERPPASVPIDQIPWKQDMEPHRINRMHPTCQHCGHGVALEGRHLREKYIINFSDYLASRTRVTKEVEEARRNRATASLASGALAGQIPTDPYTAQLKTGKLSQHHQLSDEDKMKVQALEGAGMLTPAERA